MTDSRTTSFKEFRIRDIASLNMGQSPPSEFYNEDGVGLPFFQGIADFGDRSPDVNFYCSKPTKIADIGDVLFTVRAPVGELNLADTRCCIGRGIASIRAKNPDANFLFYYLKYIKPYFVAISNGTTYDAVNKKDIEKAKVHIPDLNIRKKIGSVLTQIDDLIGHNYHRLAIIEEIAQLIYREWFVEFRFPGYQKHKFVDSELGKIPEGWDVLKVKDVLQKYIGGGWGAEDKNDIYDTPAYVMRGTDIPRAKTGDFSECPLRFHKNSNFKSRKLIPGDIVFEVSGGSEGQPLGRAVFINEVLLGSFDENVICASFCKLIRANKITSPEYLYLTLNHWGNTGQLAIYEVQSTGISNYQFEAFIKNVKMIVPDKEVLTQFSNLMNDIYKEIQILGKINKTLRDARGLLLPKLMSGEIDVSKLDINIDEN